MKMLIEKLYLLKEIIFNKQF